MAKTIRRKVDGKVKDLAYWTRKFIFYLFVAFVMICILAPFLVMFCNSFMDSTEMFKNTAPNYHVIPKRPTLENYRRVLAKPGFSNALTNSTVISSFSTLLTAALAVPSGYAISRFLKGTRGQGVYQFSLLFGTMLPTMAILIPLFKYSADMGLYDTWTFMIFVYTAFNIPFAIWIMRGFFDTIPLELTEAAYVDGCTHLRAMLLVELPLALPGLASTMIFTFVSTWNEFLLAMVLTSKNAQTWPVWVGLFRGAYDFDFGAMLAAGVLGTLPVLIMAQIFQRWIVAGLVRGAVKG